MKISCEWKRKMNACEANVRRYTEYKQLYDKGTLDCSLTTKAWFHAITQALLDLSQYEDDARIFIVGYYNLDGEKSKPSRKPIGIYGELHYVSKATAYRYKNQFLTLVYAYAVSEGIFDEGPRPGQLTHNKKR